MLIFFEKTDVTTGPASGAQPLARPHHSAITHADSNSFARALSPDALVNLGDGKTVSSFVPEYEVGAVCLLAAVLLAPVFFVFACVFFGMSLFDFG